MVKRSGSSTISRRRAKSAISRRTRISPPPERHTAAHEAVEALFPPGPPVVVDLRETPHAHAICRSCARIASVDFTDDDLRALEELADRGPYGWEVDGVTFTLTGSCPQCRAEPSS